MKKIFFCDIDGTIIDGSRGLLAPSEKTKYAFKELCKENYVFIASGRCKGLLPQVIKDLNPNGYILCNGAYSEVDNKEIYSEYFDDETVRRIIDVSLKNNGFYVLETLNHMFVNDVKAENFIKFLEDWGVALEGFKNRDDLNNKYHIAMIGFPSEIDCKNMENELNDYVGLGRHHEYKSYDVNIKGIDKGYAVNKILNYLNIPKENSYCFGDGINDLEMLLSVGHPVIMDNCVKELRRYNFEETDDVLWDGFYNYLVNNKLIKAM